MTLWVNIEILGRERLQAALSRLQNIARQLPSVAARDLASEFKTSPRVPTRTGGLRASHTAVGAGGGTAGVAAGKRVGKYSLARLVISGHRTLVTPKQRRYWFWLLRSVYGGHYIRRTKGRAGTVPPRPYHRWVVSDYIARGKLRTLLARAVREAV